MTHLSPEETIGSVDHGLPLDVQDVDGNTPLMLAAYHGHAETVQMRIERGAPSARDTAMFDRLDLLG